jgi:hypothetical protein
MEAPASVEMWCGVRAVSGVNLRSSWSDSLKTTSDVLKAADTWRTSGT